MARSEMTSCHAVKVLGQGLGQSDAFLCAFGHLFGPCSLAVASCKLFAAAAGIRGFAWLQ